MDDPAAVGRRLREARLAAGLSQRRLSFEGCTPAYISRIEAGARVPSYQILIEFARRLDVSPEYLATGSDSLTMPDPLLDAEVAMRLGDLEQAERIYSEQRTAAGVPEQAARSLAGLGKIAFRRGDVGDAVRSLEDALSSGRLPLGDATDTAEFLAHGYVVQGRYEQAFDLLARFLTDARERDDQLDVVRFSSLLANAYADSGNFSRAQEVLGDVLDLARRSLDPMLKAGLYWSQSRLYSSQGKPDLAARFARLTVDTLKESEHTLQAARAVLLLAHIENDRGNATAALELVDEAEPIAAIMGDPADRAMFTIERARALAALGERERAASLMLGAVGSLGEASPTTGMRAYAAAADFFRSQGDADRALELYELAAERATTPDRHLADVLTAMAEIHEERGEADKALQLLKTALAARTGARS